MMAEKTGEPQERLVALAGACNFRDLGGYLAASGQITRWGRLFRSDALHELTAADMDILQRLGLSGVIDLRTAAELDRTGPAPMAAGSFRYLHVSVLPEEGGESAAAPVGPEDDLAERYLWYLDVGRGALVAALQMIAEPTSHPLVFHCTAGKDRTGVLAALVLDLVGVDRSSVVDDYALTATRMPCIVARLRRDPLVGERVDQIPASRLSVGPDTMERFLDGLHHRHGGARGWALDSGVSSAELDRLSSSFLRAA
jgi:hypothetical protein